MDNQASMDLNVKLVVLTEELRKIRYALVAIAMLKQDQDANLGQLIELARQ
jgi:hypothetical protein